MRWTYLVMTKNEPRIETRVFQIVDHQQTAILGFSGYRLGNELSMTLIVEADESRAKRIEDLLRKLQAILRIEVFPERQGLP